MAELVNGLLFIIFTAVVSQTLPPPFTEECVSGRYPPKEIHQVPTYKVNLDLPPRQRWTEVMKDKGPRVVALLKQFKMLIREFGNSSQLIVNLIDRDLGYLVDTLPSPFDEEIRGIAHLTGVPLGEVALYNIFYEIFTVCTSIVAQDSQGKLYHARNLDFGLFMGWNVKNNTWEISELLKPMIINLEFQSGGKTIFKSVNFAGYIGILTAVKKGLFTFSMNERFNIKGGYIGILEWILGSRKGNWMGFLTREVMEKSTSYADAYLRLSRTPMLSPAYFILGGNQPGQATVITRSLEKAVNIWDMNGTTGDWYRLETNYDHWLKPLFLDDRRTPAVRCMNNKTQKAVSFAMLYDVLSSKPVLNKLTTYTALMSVYTGELETYLRSCPDPCYPF